jgi:hypothetical protein
MSLALSERKNSLLLLFVQKHVLSDCGSMQKWNCLHSLIRLINMLNFLMLSKLAIGSRSHLLLGLRTGPCF